MAKAKVKDDEILEELKKEFKDKPFHEFDAVALIKRIYKEKTGYCCARVTAIDKLINLVSLGKVKPIGAKMFKLVKE